jgi:ribosomal protein S18 acetylase RimI-like enzyme
VIAVRPARPDDEQALGRIDALTWTSDVSPSPTTEADRPFFGPGTAVDDVLVAEDDGSVVGYIRVQQSMPIPSRAHVLDINGLAVDPHRQRVGAGRALVDAAIELARTRGARKLSLRVLGPNAPARALYEARGFRVEGVLLDEFFLAGRYVDDVLMARDLTDAG